jgi:REP-associated tyrosine transposase
LKLLSCERILLALAAMKKDVQLPGVSLHLIRRGINRTTVFGDNEDFELFLALLEASSRTHDVSVHSYTLMTNHYHLLATPNQPNAASRMIQELNREYVRHFNSRYERIGTLWAGRLRDIPITDETYLLTCMRYIEHNPVRARMVSAPADYEWSTYRVHAFGAPNDWIVLHDTYLALGPTPIDRQMAYRALSEAALKEAELVRQRNGLSAQRGRGVELLATPIAT